MKNKRTLIIIVLFAILFIGSFSYFIFNKISTNRDLENEQTIADNNTNNINPTDWEKHCLSKMDDIMANNEYVRPGLELIENVQEEASEHCSSENVVNDKNVDGLIYRKTQLCRVGDEVLFIAEVYNYTYGDVDAKINEVVFLDKDKNELASIIVHMNPIKSAESGIALKFTKDINFSLDEIEDYEVREKLD